MKRTGRYYYDLICELVKKEIKVRYKNNILGYAWSILNPLAQALVFYVAFQKILKVQIPEYVLFLVLGLFPWQWFLNSIAVSSTSMISNANLIKKTVFPREYIVYAGVLNDAVHFLLSIPVLALFLLVYHQHVDLRLLIFFPILAIIQLFVTMGIALLISAINVFFRDMERLVVIILNMAFYGTPVVYAETMIPARLHFFVYANPMSLIIINYRNILLHQTINWQYLGLSAVYGVAIFMFGSFIFKRLKPRFAEVI